MCCCKPPQEHSNHFSDEVCRKIADYKDRRLSDSLHVYFSHTNATYRREAVLAFASIQDTIAVSRIASVLLNDSATAVREAAAFALGQIKCKASANALVNASARYGFPLVAESLGKTASDPKQLEALLQNGNTTPEGIAWMYYRYGLNNPMDTVYAARTASLLNTNQAYQTRLGAAHFLSRGVKELAAMKNSIIESATADSAAEVRMASTLALRKIKQDTIVTVLQQIALRDEDYRVRVNAVRALQDFPVAKTFSVLKATLADQNVNVAIAASEVLKAGSNEDLATELPALARAQMNWRIKANLYEAALRAEPDKEVAKMVITLTDQPNPYHQAAYLSALQHYLPAHNFVYKTLLEADTPVVRSSAASALTTMVYNKKITPSLKQKFAGMFTEAVKKGDMAVIGIVAEVLADSALNWKTFIQDATFLYDAKAKLTLPKDNEALQSLERAIAYFEGKHESTPVQNTFNHPINWALVNNIPKDQQAKIKTSKGEIIIRLFVDEAPGSVANFVSLVKQDYFTNKFFHRVVPNFVVQAGCNRGDGWGSEDYSIRSEFSPRRYKAGSVGMASAGKDTEGTQWFITHSPTPHLDGRYTIFAEVVKGMEVVHRLEVGDRILNVELFYPRG